MNAGTVQHDVTWFVDQAAWLAPSLTVPTWGGFLGWMAQWLTPESTRRLRGLLPLDRPEQRDAETTLIAVLRSELLNRRSDCWEVHEFAERNVDWAVTYATAETRPILQYRARVLVEAVDQDTRAALLSLAQGWEATLLAFGHRPEHADRAARLTDAVRAAGLRDSRGAAYLMRHERRLVVLGGVARQAAAAIRAALGIWGVRLDAKGNGLRQDLIALSTAFIADPRNVNDLLEVSVRIAIARAACNAAADDLPDGVPWQMARRVDCSHSGKPRLLLQSGDMMCEISKGRPRLRRQGIEYDAVDRLISAGKALGLAPTGNQPDLVFAFWRIENPDRRIFALGDAKRNASGDGLNYVAASIEVAAVYCVSYGHVMHLELDDKGFQGPIMPAMTLFTLQGAASELLDPANIAAKLRRLDVATPFVLTLDYRRHFGTEHGDGILAAWFGRLARQADRFLRMPGVAQVAPSGCQEC